MRSTNLVSTNNQYEANSFASAASSWASNTGIASAHLGFATAQSLIYSAMGGSALQLPTVSRPTDLAGEYKVPGPGNTYRASISSVSSTNYYYGWWGGYWWGAWGYYGSGYWYSGYGGYGGFGGYGDYGGYLYGSQVSSAASVSLTEPQKQFPGSFWQIDASSANDPWEALEVQYRYGNASGEALVSQVELPEGSFTRLPTVDTKISSGMKSINDEVIDLMQELGDTAGDLWTLVGSINLAPLAKRISSNLAELAPELTQNELQQRSDSYSSSYTEQPVRDTSLASGAISIAPATDQSSSAVALQLVNEKGELADEAETLTPEELEKAKQIAVETFAQQMLLKAAENSSAEIVQVILDQYKDNADLQNALIMMLQSYKVVTADAWWSDYWIDHEKRTVYVSSKNNFYTRDAKSIVGELEGAIRDDSQFYKMFGLDESWEGFSSRIGFGVLEAVGGGFTIAGGVFLAVAPEPTMVTKAGAVVAYAEGGNLVVAGLSSAWGRESRIDIIGSGLEKYYDVTGVDKDLRWIGRGGLLVSNLALGFVGPATKWSSIRAFLSNSKAFAQQSLTCFQELLHSGKSICEIAKIDDIKALVFASETTALASRSSSSWDDLLGSVGKYQFRSVSDLTKWEMISAELRTLIPQLKLIVGKGEYTFSGDILRARQVLADLTAVTGKEVALLILPGGRQIIRVGTSSSRVSAKGATEIVAHTHPNGFLMLSDDAAKAAAADTKQLAARGQYQTYLVGPAGDLVKWQSPSETWFDDMVGTIIRGGN